MSGRGRPTFMKRQKEAARKRKQLDKSMKRAERTAERKDREPDAIGGEDPDIAGIIPGPQPLPEEYGIVDDFRAPPGQEGELVEEPTEDEEGEEESTG